MEGAYTPYTPQVNEAFDQSIFYCAVFRWVQL